MNRITFFCKSPTFVYLVSPYAARVENNPEKAYLRGKETGVFIRSIGNDNFVVVESV
ncbi:hypothetical protein [Brevibacillus sp. SIMBA_040]|uniref:hypothetical protein n=1 Tax=unclassified Brevibacillus TaxID=2684853 RepID=UPI0039783421